MTALACQGGLLLFSEEADTLFELVGVGRELAAAGGGSVTSFVCGADAHALAEECCARGADDVVLLANPTAVGEEERLAGLLEAVRMVDPETIMIGGTRAGADLAGRLAQILQAPCASNCVALRPAENNALTVERRVYGGRFVARQILEGAPRIVTVPPKRFPKAERHDGTCRSIREITVAVPAPRVRRRAVLPRARSSVDVTKAEVIVAAGRGVKKLEDLAMLERLAAALGGVLAGSRPLTGDVDWLPVDRRIGLSGQTVKPNLYIACGISGQIEHIVGMKGARTIVAINNDPKAPIHDEADYSVIGDLYEVVPALLKACERLTGVN